MSDPFERKLAAQYIAGHLIHECANNPTVRAYLTAAGQGDMPLAGALVACIKELVHQNKRLLDAATEKAMREPPVLIQEHNEKGMITTLPAAKTKERPSPFAGMSWDQAMNLIRHQVHA